VSKAVGWALIFGLLLLLGTHPGTTASLVQHALAGLAHAGDELVAFVGKL